MISDLNLTILFASVVAGAAPVVIAAIGETLTEKAGVINLALDGTILLSAMTAFAVAYETDSLILGFGAAGLVGALVAGLVALFSIYLGQSQVAVGFVLTLMCRDLAYFLGNPYARIQGPQASPTPLPFLKEIPFFGSVFCNHNPAVYFSLALIFISWWCLYHTSYGLKLRSVGENPAASFVRGINPRQTQMLYTLCGGFLVGLSGAVFSLAVKPGWGRPQGAEGVGWIALALVIFGGWHPIRAAIGAYFFAFLQVIGIHAQTWLPNAPSQVVQVAPFPLMIFTLALIHLAQKETVSRWIGQNAWIGTLIRLFSGKAPQSLGKPLNQ